MFQLIPIDKRKGKRCHFCGTTLSVKYEIDINDPVISNKSSKVYCCNRCALSFDNQREIYNPMTHGAIIAVHIYLEDGYKPMAELAFAFGGTETIHWDDVKEREPYLKGINAYTIMCDDRAKFPFEKYVIAR